MKLILNNRTKILITATAAVFVLSILILEHFRGGVITHHLLAMEDLPGISNWWGILTIPLATWIVLSLLQKRHQKSAGMQQAVSKAEMYGFTAAFIFGIILTVLFYNIPEMPGYLILATFGLALFRPIYQPQYYLGFILGMTYGFGGILPVLFGMVLFAVYAFEYHFIRRGVLYVLSATR